MDFLPLVDRAVERHGENLWALSRFLWANPELALEEFKAHDELCGLLERHGFVVHRRHLLETAFRAEFNAPGGTEGPTVAIMAEYDALPSIGHACGHNLIAESTIGAALAVMEAMQTTYAVRGKLVVLGTPAEENCGGKEMLLQRGAFKDIDVAMMAHPSVEDTLRPNVVARTKTTVHFRGKTAHAAVCPWEGVNALDAAVASYVNISLLRQHLKPSSRIHGTIMESGSYPNIIPESSKLVYNIRGETVSELNELVGKAESCFRAAAQATGCTMTMESGMQYKDLVHNTVLAKLYRKHGHTLGLTFTDDDMGRVAFLGAATDAGNVSHELPTLHPSFAIPSTAGNHTRPYAQAANSPEAQAPTRRAAKLLALTALDLLTDPALLAQVKREFSERKARRT
ncbi:xaa-Arg dipeptidase-like [Amblyomma americanum]